MLCIVCALHAEAAPLIEAFKLKKDTISPGPAFFRGDSACLIESGIGKVRAAAATARLLTFAGVCWGCTAVNIGLAGAMQPLEIGCLVLANRIRDDSSGVCYYPDILVRHGLKEAPLATVDRPIDDPQNMPAESLMVDMEGAGFFEAASALLPPHKILVLKIISDNLSPKELSPRFAGTLIAERLEEILRVLAIWESQNAGDGWIWEQADEIRLRDISSHLRLTFQQRAILRSKAREFLARGGESLECLAEYLESEPRSKIQAKQVFSDLLKRLSPPAKE